MKNKHAKGPDGQPLININSGRGRGRPKKNASAGLRFSHIEPSSEAFFKASSERAGGPVPPSLGFKEVYTEIYIKRAAKPLPNPAADDGDERIEDGDGGPEEAKGADSDKVKKKRGRKPKSFYLQQQQEQERMAKEQAEARKQELQEAENEEEVIQRQDEYKQHALFSTLALYSVELHEFIEERKKKQAELQAQREQEIAAGKTQTPNAIINNILSRYEEQMRMSGSIFQTQKILGNNSNIKPTDKGKSEDDKLNETPTE
jgi:hypothetical protein